MIKVKIKGGIGNQMFQYATARALSLFNDTGILLDVLSYNNSNRTYPYPFVLDKFNILDIRGNTNNPRMITEKHYYWDDELLQRLDDKDVILDGYWQAEEYFKMYRNIILREFILKEEYETSKLSCQKTYLSGCKNPIFVHVRRKERVDNPAARKIHGLIPNSFYIEALQMMNKWFPDSLIVGVSDDYQWLDDEFGEVINTTLEGFSDYETLYLMSKCKHGIIANSSFSWWGAWLINNPDKIIIGPSRWTVKESDSNVNILPSEWIKLKTKLL